jgi:hypothetical protein
MFLIPLQEHRKKKSKGKKMKLQGYPDSVCTCREEKEMKEDDFHLHFAEKGRQRRRWS